MKADNSRRRPTQADVARHAGVSQTTVSQVLSQSGTIAVPEETRQRILAAVAALGYIPDHTARSLRIRKTYTIASIIPDITNPFYPAFERGIQDIADQSGYDLITYNTDGIAEKEQRCLRSIQQGRADGVIVVLFHLSARELLPLLDMNIAVVRLEAERKQPGQRPLDDLFVDNIAAATAAVSYLIKAGHRRIGMIAGELGPGQTRLLGYRQALEREGITFLPELVRSGDFTVESGQHWAKQLLSLWPRPTAIFAANDMMAMGTLAAARNAGLQVPHDLAIVGFDNVPSAALVTPALTTISLHEEQIGRRAASLLIERLEGRAPEHGRSEEQPFELIVRESA
jgi:LacI family transcriptional regulator